MSHLRIVPLFALLLVALAACGDMGNATNTGTVVTPTTAAQSAPTPKPSHFKVGQTVKIGDWEITVNGVKASNGTDIVTTDPGKKFVLINVTLHNVGTKSQDVSSAVNFKLKQSDGTQGANDSFVASTLGGSPAPDGTVAPDDKLRGDLVFTVMKEEKHLTFTFQPDLLDSGKSAVWDLTL